MILKKSLIVIREEGLGKFIFKTIRYLFALLFRYFLYDKKENDLKWEKLKNKYHGERVFLVGNGPSLNVTPLHLLENEYVMCFNNFHLMTERIVWFPSFYMVVDSLVAKNIRDKINVFVSKTMYAFFPDIHKNGVNFRKFINNKENVLWMYHTYLKFSRKLPKVGSGGSVIYEGLQVLLYLGFSEIILIGVDMNYEIHKNTTKIYEKGVKSENAIESIKDDDPNHFDPRYFGKGSKYHQPESRVISTILNSLEIASKEISKTNTSVINAGYNSLVTSFPTKEFRELFKFTFDDEKNIFSKVISKKTIFESLDSLIKNSLQIEDFISEIHLKHNFYINVNKGKKLINTVIFTHLPLGPFNGKIYFINRNFIKK